MTREEQMQKLIVDFTDAVYLTLCESNGLSDNAWTRPDGTVFEAEYPVPSFIHALKALDAVYEKGVHFLDPEKAERDERWRVALQTARYLVARHKTEKRDGSLERNIADAIVGNIRVEDSNDAPPTMTDKLNQLVERGELVEWKPKRSD